MWSSWKINVVFHLGSIFTFRPNPIPQADSPTRNRVGESDPGPKSRVWLIPPPSIENRNLGTGATNPEFYVNNDIDDAGLFLQDLGYDGFTTVLTAESLGLGPGTHTIKLAISDHGFRRNVQDLVIGAQEFLVNKRRF